MIEPEQTALEPDDRFVELSMLAQQQVGHHRASREGWGDGERPGESIGGRW